LKAKNKIIIQNSVSGRAFLTQEIINGNCNFLVGKFGGRLSTVDLLIKVAHFVTKVNNIFQYKKELIKTG
jgi:hypothetical protein